MLLDPSLCHKLSLLLGPLPLERAVLYGRPLSRVFSTRQRTTDAPIVVIGITSIVNSRWSLNIPDSNAANVFCTVSIAL